MSDTPAAPVDFSALIRSRDYQRLLVLSGLIGFAVSVVAWGFLSLVPWLQDLVYLDLPDALGFDTAPVWWPIPVLAIAGLITAFAIARMHGGGGGVPAQGLSGGITQPADLPSVLLAALATLGLGLVLGPSSPVIALGMGVALLVLRRVKKDAPVEIQNVVAASGGFASLAMVFSNPIVAAIITIEAMGIGGAMAPVVVLPGLMAAGIGSLVYFGLGQLTGLSTNAYALEPLDLSPLGELTVAQFGWTIVMAFAASVVASAVVVGGRWLERRVRGNYFVWVPIAGVVVALLAIAFAESTDQTENAILFSGSRALSPLVQDAATLSVATLALLVLFKALAWSVSMGSFRGGPVFPAIFLGTAGGLLASHLPGLPQGAAVPVVMAATVMAVLRLPLAAAIIALLLTDSAGIQATPLIIVSVVISYVVADTIYAWWESVQPEVSPP